MMIPILRNFDLAIIKAPKEGLMGLTRDGKEVILHNGDMVSLKWLDERYANLLYLKGMLTPIKMRDLSKNPIDWSNRGKLKIRRSRKNRGKKNGTNLDNWLGVKLRG